MFTGIQNNNLNVNLDADVYCDCSGNFGGSRSRATCTGQSDCVSTCGTCGSATVGDCLNALPGSDDTARLATIFEGVTYENWMSTCDACQWTGVTCNSQGYVVDIVVDGV